MAYRAAHIFCLCLVWLFCSGNITLAIQLSEPQSDLHSQIQQDTIETKSPTGAMLRSLALPGWGQFYNGKWFKGVLAMGVETGLVLNAIYLDAQLDNSTDPFNQEFYRNNRNLSFWWLGATILLSMLDAYVDAHLYHFDESSDLSFQCRVPDKFTSSGWLGRQVFLTYQVDF